LKPFKNVPRKFLPREWFFGRANSTRTPRLTSSLRFREHLKVISDHRKRFTTREWWQYFLQGCPWPPESAFETRHSAARPVSNTMPGTFPDTGRADYFAEVTTNPSSGQITPYGFQRRQFAFYSAFVALLGSLVFTIMLKGSR
jgi:hypothetical protein